MLPTWFKLTKLNSISHSKVAYHIRKLQSFLRFTWARPQPGTSGIKPVVEIGRRAKAVSQPRALTQKCSSRAGCCRLHSFATRTSSAVPLSFSFSRLPLHRWLSIVEFKLLLRAHSATERLFTLAHLWPTTCFAIECESASKSQGMKKLR